MTLLILEYFHVLFKWFCTERLLLILGIVSWDYIYSYYQYLMTMKMNIEVHLLILRLLVVLVLALIYPVASETWSKNSFVVVFQRIYWTRKDSSYGVNLSDKSNFYYVSSFRDQLSFGVRWLRNLTLFCQRYLAQRTSARFSTFTS